MSTQRRSALPCFFLPGKLQPGETVTLAGEDGHKLRNVLRASEGESVMLRDSQAAAYVARILTLRPEVTLELVEPLEQTAAPELEITLVQALPKSSKMDFIVEKATELGVRRIVPLQSERVIGAREGTGKLERWRRLAKTAAQQCGAELVPQIDDVHTWAELFARDALCERIVLPWELAEGEPRSLERELDGARSVMIVIGPEGGFSHAEIELARSNGARVVSLGRRILRTETAGLVAISCARYAVGEV